MTVSGRRELLTFQITPWPAWDQLSPSDPCHHFFLPVQTLIECLICLKGPGQREEGRQVYRPTLFLTLSRLCTLCADFLQTPSLSTRSGQLGGSNQLSE